MRFEESINDKRLMARGQTKRRNYFQKQQFVFIFFELIYHFGNNNYNIIGIDNVLDVYFYALLTTLIRFSLVHHTRHKASKNDFNKNNFGLCDFSVFGRGQ